MPEENVKVAVRVRPFNRREKERNAGLIIEMNGATTTIQDPSNTNEEPKKFSFDFSYWSHDGCKENSNGYFAPDTSKPNGKKFADQQKVFDDLGVGVLTNAWEGYNSTLFAYGQTGSGKSWSMVGYGVNKGIVPLFCDQMFSQIGEKKSGGDKTEFEVSFSMLEIYNEQVRDLLDSRPPKRGGLRVRQHPKQGFYADGLQVVPVNSYAEIEGKIAEGTKNRTVASTNMNATSSRAHTIVGITFVQKFINPAGEETAKTACVNLVDLAGSERADSTGATGDRLKEGAAINQSLSCLGNCIAALADKAGGKNTRVPYRDSVLTKLLKNALGGNSKTIMIAALSPADINFEETLSTLRYADRAKQIKTTASVNEDPTEKLIRELQEENEKLKAMMASGKIEMIEGDDDEELTDEERAQIKAELEDEYKSVLEKNQKEMEEMRKTFEQRLQERGEDGGAAGMAAINEKKKTVPHLSNLNPDEQLSGQIIHFIDGPQKVVGNGKGDPPADIDARGPSIAEKHAIIKEEGGKFSIEPCEQTARVLHNGKTIGTKTQLAHNDRLIFGTTKYFVFMNPKERDSSKIQYPNITYEYASEEVAKKSGFDVSGENKSRDDALLQDDMLDLIPKISEANSISEELDKKKKFELMIVSPDARGELSGRTQVMVKVIDIETKHEWIWPKDKFINRRFKMEEMFLDFQDGDDPWDLPPDQDPFVDDVNSEFPIGCVKLWLQSLAYLIETKEQLDITDYQGREVGVVNVELLPCDKSGKVYTEKDDVFVEDPIELYGRDIYFTMALHNARGLPNKFTDVYTKFTIPFTGTDVFTTKKIPNTPNPDWNFSKQIAFTKATEEMIDYLQHGAIMLQIWGKQKPPKQKKAVNTKDAMMSAAMTKGQVQAANTNTKKVDPDKIRYMMEAAMLRKRQQIMEQKLHYMRKMIETAEEHKKKKISTTIIRDIYHAPTADQADKCIALIPLEKDDDDEDEAVLAPSGVKGNEKGKKGDDSSQSSSSESESDSDNEKKDKKKNKDKKSKKQKVKTPKTPKEKPPKDDATTKRVDAMLQKADRPSSAKNKKSSACVLL